MKIRSETIYQENLMKSDASTPLTRFKKSYVEYDDKGHQVKEYSWDAYGAVEQILLSMYEADRMVRQEVYLDEDELSEEHIFEYDAAGKLKVEVCIYAESGEERILYDYDDAGNLLRKTYLDEDGEVESYEEWGYEDGSLVSERRVEEGQTVFEHLRTYQNGILSSEIIREELMETEIMHQAGNPEIRSELRNGKRISVQSIYYDEEGKVIKIEDSTSRGRSNIIVNYDEQGNEVLREETGPEGQLSVRVKRLLDEKGEMLETELEANTRGMGIDRHYKYIYEYEYVG